MDPVLDPGLYIVATPIGNLGDITLRAIETLRGVSAIACEDTRVTGKLLKHLGIRQRLIRHDDHATPADRERLLAMMESQAIALVSDAGTPLISDPGFRLVRDARERGLAITSLPGACAAVVALTLAGLPSDRFLFAGFLPPKSKARRDALAQLQDVRATLVFHETGPRLCEALRDMGEILVDREFAVARELTKLHEECRTGPAEELAAYFGTHPAKGEIVVLAGPPEERPGVFDVDALLRVALEQAKPSQAAAAVARETGLDRRMLYARALELK